MDLDSEDQSSERAQLHFLTALVDELLGALISHGVLSRAQVQAIEAAVSEKTGTPPRAW